MDLNIIKRAESYYEYALLKRNNFPKPVTKEDFYLLALAEQVRLGGGGAVDSVVADWGNTTVTVGKLSAGTNTDGKTAIQILEAMLRGYVNASCSVSYSEVNTTLELGTSFNLTITAKNFKAGDGVCERVALYQNGSLVEEKLIESAISVSFTTINNIKTNTSFEVKLTDAKGVVTSVSKKNYQFIGATYTGVLSNIPTSSDDIISLDKLVRAKGTYLGTYSPDNQYVVYAYPSSFGSLSSILDSMSFENKTDFSVTTMTINSIEYKVYYTNDKKTLENFTYKYVF